MSLISLVVWVHMISMIGVAGALLGAQLCAPSEYRNAAGPSRAIARLANIQLIIGLLAGIAAYFLAEGYARGPHFNGVVGVKFVFLLGAGAVIGISKTTDKGDTLRWIAIALIVLASLFGTTLS